MPLPAGFAAIEFDAFHRDELARSIAGGRGELAARAAAHLAGLALRVGEGSCVTYRPRGGTIEIRPGDADAETVIETDLETWQGLVHELEAPAGLLYAGRVRCTRGNAVDFMAWETALRALYHGRVPYDPARIDLRDRRDAALDVERSFTLDDDRDEMAHFLRTAGYLFVRDVFRADEVATLRAEAEALHAEARPGDRLSWWGATRRAGASSAASPAAARSPVSPGCARSRGCSPSRTSPPSRSSTAAARATASP
jgi:hypothetical protein